MHILIYNGKEQAFPHARFPILEPLSKNPISPSVSSSPTADAMGLDSKQEFAGCGLDWSQVMQFTSPAPNQMKNDHHHQQQQQQRRRQPGLKCPRCESTNTKFCYYNNYNRLQPRHFCRTCRRHWTAGGTLRNVPVGGARKNKRTKTTHAATIDGANSDTVVPSSVSASLVSRGNFLDPFHSVSSLYDSAKLESVDEVPGIPITSGEWQLLPASSVGGGGAFEACVSGYWSCLDDDLNGFMAAVLNQ